MGNVLDKVRDYVSDRRKPQQMAARLRPNHAEELPPDHFLRHSNTNLQNRSSVTSTLTLGGVSVCDVSTSTSSKEDWSARFLAASTSSPLPPPPTAAAAATTNSVRAEPNRCSDFYLACRRNDANTVFELLQTISLDEIDRLEPNGSTALHSASYHGHSEIVKLLLQAGADRSMRNRYGYLAYDEAKDDRIRQMFFRVPSANRFVSATGDIEWELITEDALELAAEDRQAIYSIFKNNTKGASAEKMFRKIYENYFLKHLVNTKDSDKIERFFRKALEELDPVWLIKAYSAETDFYKTLNVEIASGAAVFLHERRYLIALLCHHEKLEPYNYIGRVYRIIPISLIELEKYEIGTTVMTKAFVSSSIDRKTAEIFHYRHCCETNQPARSGPRTKVDGTFVKAPMVCIYNIKHHRTALDIKEISQYVAEEEVLIMPFSVFRVKHVTKNAPFHMIEGTAIAEVELEECDQYIDENGH